ncbi:lytic transglycosylase domain-containing protein [Methylobacterium sp. CM6257]
MMRARSLAALAALVAVLGAPLPLSGAEGTPSSRIRMAAIEAAPDLSGYAPVIDLRDLVQTASPRAGPLLATDGGSDQPVTRLWADWQTGNVNVSFSPLISDAASRTGLPYDFLYRLLRQESGLRADAVSPKGALGIAQFMPATALERGLINPFDPSQAVIKAAELLRDHKARFGNLGLAAAAYNAGPGRVEKWLAGTSGMPQETRDYVLIVTGRAVEAWVPAGRWAALESAPRDAAITVPAPASRPLFADIPAVGRAGRIKIGSPAKGRTGSRRHELVARSEDDLCTLLGRDGNACVVRRTY